MQSVTSYKYHPGTSPRVGSLLIVRWLVSTRSSRWAHLPVLAVRYTSGSSPCWERSPVERACPHYIPFCVLPWSQPNLARRSGAPGDVWYLCTVYREPVINVVVVGLEQNCVRVVPRLGPQIHWSCDEPWAGALRSMGDHSESLVEVKNIHNEKASMFHDVRK